MTRAQQWIAAALVLAVIAGGVLVASRSLSDEFVQVRVGDPAPRFQAVTLDSTPAPRSLEDYRGQVVVLNVWATWCAPCRTEMPSFQRLHDAYAGKGVRVVAVSVDAPGMEGPIREFVREFGLTFDILYDSQGAIQRDYTTIGVPETFLIGKDGVIRHKAIGPHEWDGTSVTAILDRLIAEPSS